MSDCMILMSFSLAQSMQLHRAMLGAVAAFVAGGRHMVAQLDVLHPSLTRLLCL